MDYLKKVQMIQYGMDIGLRFNPYIYGIWSYNIYA